MAKEFSMIRKQLESAVLDIDGVSGIDKAFINKYIDKIYVTPKGDNTAILALSIKVCKLFKKIRK